MGRIPLIALLALVAAAPQGRGTDNIGRSKAPTAVKKGLAASLKKKTAALQEDIVTLVNQQETKTAFTGVMMRDFSGVRGTAEVYTFRTSVLARDSNNQLVPPDKMEDRDAMAPSAYRPPSTFLSEVGRLAPKAGYGKTEIVDGVDCKIIYLSADPALVKQQLKEVGDRVARGLRAAAAERQRLFAGALFSGNLSSYFDLKKTRSAYAVWVGLDDLLIRRIEWTFTTAVKENAFPKGGLLNRQMPALETISVTTKLSFTRWGEKPDFKIPPEITAKWGVR